MQVRALRDGSIDIGIFPGPVPTSEFICAPFVEGPLLMAVPQGHALAESGRAPLGAFANESFVLFPPWMRSRLLDVVQQSCVDAGFAPVVSQEAEQLYTLLALVAAGLGVTLVPQWVADARQPGVDFVQLEDPQPHYSLFLVSRPENQNPAIPLFKSNAGRFDSPERQSTRQSEKATSE